MTTITTTLVVIASLFALASAKERTGYGTAYSAAYDMDATGKNMCEYDAKSLPDRWQVYYGAMNEADWNASGGKSGICGRCIRAKGVKGETTPGFNIKPVIVKIVDQCPDWACDKGNVDFSMTALEAITGYDWDKKLITWDYVDCGTGMTSEEVDGEKAAKAAKKEAAEKKAAEKAAAEKAAAEKEAAEKKAAEKEAAEKAAAEKAAAEKAAAEKAAAEKASAEKAAAEKAAAEKAAAEKAAAEKAAAEKAAAEKAAAEKEAAEKAAAEKEAAAAAAAEAVAIAADVESTTPIIEAEAMDALDQAQAVAAAAELVTPEVAAVARAASVPVVTASQIVEEVAQQAEEALQATTDQVVTQQVMASTGL